MSKPTGHKTVQARIPACAKEVEVPVDPTHRFWQNPPKLFKKMSKEQPIGYVLYGTDNDSDMIDDQVDIMRCDLCGKITRNTSIFDSFKLRKKRYDISYTYDGFLIVSSQFKVFCEQSGIGGIVFYSLPKEDKFHVAEILPVLEFDSDRRGTVFRKLCPGCNQYDSITGVSPPYLKNPSRLDSMSFFRSDLLFGRLDAQFYLVICSKALVEKIRSAKFKGLSLDPIHQ